MSEEKKPGRPSKYNPEFCQQLIDHMAEGLSFESFAAVIGVNQDTLYEWVKVHDDFSEAKKTAYNVNLLFWEKQGIDGLYSIVETDEDGNIVRSKSINSTVWIFNMKNRHKWRDKQEGEDDRKVEHSGNINISQTDVNDRIKQLKENKN